MRPLLSCLFLACAFGARAGVYVVPVATAKYHDRYYTTTLTLQNPSGVGVQCEAVYASPNDPSGGTLRATYDLPPGATRIEREVLREAGAIGTLRVACTDEIALSVRIQTSTDGVTFGNDRVFHGVGEEHPIRSGAPRWVRTTRAVVIMEVLGRDAEVRAIRHDATGVAIGERTYPLPAFAQQIITPTDQTASLELIVSGTGGIVAQTEGDRRRAATTSTTNKAKVLAGLPAGFKAAPFQEPLNGLILMRDRWFDPRTGTFLSPDPEGYADSANLQAFCAGDPVNCADPSGRAAAVSLSGKIIGITPQGRRYEFDRAFAQTHPDQVQVALDNDGDLTDAEVEDIMRKVGLRAAVSGGPCKRGIPCLYDPRKPAPPLRHLPSEGALGYAKGAAIALANGSTGIGPALTHDQAYMPLGVTTREQQAGVAVTEVVGATASIVGAARGIGRGRAPAQEPVNAFAPETLGSPEGMVQSTRVNLFSEAMAHVVDRHFSGRRNASQFTITELELRILLQSPEVLRTSVARPLFSERHGGLVYVREVHLGKVIGVDKMTGKPTSTMTVITLRDGTLETAFPGVVDDVLEMLP